jgi:CheY-specific phosphatase CheX
MNIQHVNPFIAATITTSQTMCGVKPQRAGELQLKKNGFMDVEEIVGMIGLGGGIRGAVLLSMTVETAKKFVGGFLMGEIPDDENELTDGFGEIVNIIAGAAAADLAQYNIKLALPTVMMGQNKRIFAKESAPWVVIPMKFPEWGNFTLEVSITEEK